MEIVNYRPIGIIHSPFKRLEGTPIQPTGGIGVRAQVEIFSEGDCIPDGVKNDFVFKTGIECLNGMTAGTMPHNNLF